MNFFQIEEIIRKLHIQVDNLCQFLPQEQVQNFSRLKDKQLLVGTMKAVGKLFYNACHFGAFW